ncbi:MAG: HNH endonuclease [Candidatus Methylomirabilia bacterium]
MVVLQRDGKRCVRCGSDGVAFLRRKRRRLKRKPRWHPEGGLHVHHQVPIASGGHHGLNNLVTLCGDCHSDEHPQVELLRQGRRRKKRNPKPPP